MLGFQRNAWLDMIVIRVVMELTFSHRYDAILWRILHSAPIMQMCPVVPIRQVDRTDRTVRQCAGVPCGNGAPIPILNIDSMMTSRV